MNPAFPYKGVVILVAAVNLILGLLLLIKPDTMRRLNERMKTWVSTDRLEKKLDASHDVDAQLFRVRTLLGIVSLIFSLILGILCIMY